MTCIVGIAREGAVYIGGDSCGSTSSSWVHVPNPKVFPLGEGMLVGAAGSFRMIDLLRFSVRLPAHDAAVSADAFMRTAFVAALRKTFLDEGYLHRECLRDSGGNFMVGYQGQLFEVQDDFSVLNAPEYGLSCGSGEAPARGSLWTTRGAWDCRLRVQQALEAAEATTPSVRGPFLILET